MQRNTYLRRGLLAAALAVAVAPAFAGGPYSKTVFFGDSLTDSGHFRPALVQAIGSNGALLGRFTTNPGLVWSEYMADYYGTQAVSDNQGGTNYAVGGARVGTNTAGALGAIPSLSTQLTSYLAANGGKADAQALYTVWGGANDLFAVAGGAPAQSTITNAVTTQVGIVATLENAGARYVLVPTVPDLGVTPQFRAGGAANMAAGTQLTTTYNTALFAGLSGAGLRVIPLDTFHLLQEIVASPAAYGFANVTGTACNPQITASSLTCSALNFATPDAASSYAFADGVHPSTRAHEILADYTISVLEGPRQLALLPHSARVVGLGRATQVAEHLSSKPEADGTYWWGGLRADSQRYGHGDVYDGTTIAGTFGVDWARGDWVYGGFGGVGSGKLDFGPSTGDFKQTEISLGGFIGWNPGKAWVNGQLGYTQLGYKVNRDVQLGPVTRRHSGSPDGSNISAGISGGYTFGEAVFQHGPVLSLVAQRIKIDGYAEDNPSATALAFPDHDLDSLVGSIGWQLSYQLAEHVRPYARVSWSHEFEDAPAEAFATLQSIPTAGQFAVPGLDLDGDYSRARIGARSNLLGLDADMGLDATLDRKGGRDISLYLTVAGKF